MSVLSCVTNPVACSTDAASSTFFNTLAQWVAESVSWVVSGLGQAMNSTDSPRLVMSTSAAESSIVTGVVPTCALVALLISTVVALRRIDTNYLAASIGGGLPLVALGVGFVRPVAHLLLIAGDQLSQRLGPHDGALIGQWSARLVSLPGGLPGAALLLMSTLIVVTAFLLWCELTLRTVALSLLLVVAPIVFAASPWPPARRWVLRWVETFIGLTLAKVLIAITIAAGVADLSTNSVSSDIVGAATLGLAAWSPFLILRLLPLVENSALHSLDGVRRRTVGAAVGGARAAVSMASGMMPAVEPPMHLPSPDSGIGDWPHTGDLDAAPAAARDVAAPVSSPEIPSGRHVVGEDRMGPVVLWHADD
jgi:hypothetical protein